MVSWFTVKRFNEIPGVLKDIKLKHGNLKGMIPIGTDPIKLGGNYRVLVFKKGHILIKIEGPLEIIYNFQNELNAILIGKRPEPEI